MTTERSQCVGLVLALIGQERLRAVNLYTRDAVIDLLEQLATEMEAQQYREPTGAVVGREGRWMGEGMHFATLAALVGKKFGARWGARRVTIGAVGWKDGSRFVMGTLSDGGVVLGEPQDFTLPTKRKSSAGTSEA